MGNCRDTWLHEYGYKKIDMLSNDGKGWMDMPEFAAYYNAIEQIPKEEDTTHLPIEDSFISYQLCLLIVTEST